MILEAKVRKPCSELNPGVWQGDCFVGIDRNRSKMFRRPGMHMPVLWRQTLIALMIARKFRTRRLALHALPMRRGTAVRNRPDITGRRRFRPGRNASSGGMLLDAEARRRGETRGEHVRISFSPWNAAQESQNLRARSQRRSYGFAARLTLGWKADQRSARRLPQSVLVVCWACSAVWRCKSSGHPDGGECLVRCKGYRRE